MSVFDGGALMTALDAQRAARGLGWNEVADELWKQSSELNARLSDHSMCPGALVRTAKRGTMSCPYALTILRWIRAAPEQFLTSPRVDVGDVRLSDTGADRRPRWDLNQLYAALNKQRQERRLTWSDQAKEFDCTPSRLTNLRTARLADMDLTMRIAQWLRRPAATFVYPARW
jgi:hypothetical protein